MKKIVLLLMLLLMPLASASTLTVESVAKAPEQISPGDVISLGITLENDGSKDIKDIRVSLDLANLPFAPIESSEVLIEKIDNDEKGLATFSLQAFPNAVPGVYKIPINIASETQVIKNSTSPIKISAENQDIQTFTSITIDSNPNLEVGIEESTIVTTNAKGKIVIRFVNTGDGEVRFLTAKIPRLSNYEVLTQNTFYIGNIEPDDFETIEAEIMIKENTQAIPLEVSYKDDFNREFKKVYPLEIKTYLPDEAKQLGLVQNSNTPLIITIIVIVLIIFFVYRRFKKKQ